MHTPSGDTPAHAPLVSNRFLNVVIAVVCVLALLSLAIHVLGRTYGEGLMQQGETDSEEIHQVVIGQDQLHLPANVMRFAEQRRDGAAERLDLYFLWPEMTGFRQEFRSRFHDIAFADDLIFVQVSQSTMSRDMSGRLEPIYSHLFSGPPEPGPHGLTLHRLRAESGYGDEVLLTARRPDGRDYVVRCILRGDAPASSGDCQRDIHVGRDLTVLYRFSVRRLPNWDQLDRSVRAYIDERLQPQHRAATTDKMPPFAVTNHSP